MDPDDNLNLVQPVNPWSGSAWSMYTEYYQWSPTSNSNSDSFSVESGQTLHGAIVYDESTDSYELTQTIVETGDVSTQTVPCQSGKAYRVPYIVYEKTFPCKDYPSDEIVTFNIVAAECDGKDCLNDIEWSSAVKDDNCNMQANIVSQSEISITWDTSAASVYDDYTRRELLELNRGSSEWANAAADELLAQLDLDLDLEDSNGSVCPGSGAWISHASCDMNVAFTDACADVVTEVNARVAGQYADWHDPHNNGTYTIKDASADQMSLERTTGDGKYTDKMILTFTDNGSGGCSVGACSESQVTSYIDYSTNYCNLHSLFCADAGCYPQNAGLTYTESFNTCSAHDDVCLAV
jgi:hypothetical protein